MIVARRMGQAIRVCGSIDGSDVKEICLQSWLPSETIDTRRAVVNRRLEPRRTTQQPCERVLFTKGDNPPER